MKTLSQICEAVALSVIRDKKDGETLYTTKSKANAIKKVDSNVSIVRPKGRKSPNIFDKAPIDHVVRESEYDVVKPNKKIKIQSQPRMHGVSYNPAPKLFKFAQKAGFRRVGTSEKINKDKVGAVIEKYPVHHMKSLDPDAIGHHIIVSRKGFIHRDPTGKIKTGQNAGGLKRHLRNYPEFAKNLHVQATV